MKLYSLSQNTRYGSHTVARVKAPNKPTARRLFLAYYRQRGLPHSIPSSVGMDVGCIVLTIYEEATLPSDKALPPRTVTPINTAGPPVARHHGIDLSPGLTPPTKKPRPKTKVIPRRKNVRLLPKRK